MSTDNITPADIEAMLIRGQAGSKACLARAAELCDLGRVDDAYRMADRVRAIHALLDIARASIPKGDKRVTYDAFKLIVEAADEALSDGR
jgi:hypothetical protein